MPRHRLGFTCGTFDILHAGHVKYLNEASWRCDHLIVAVNTDESVRRYKGRPPVVPYDQRAYIIGRLIGVDEVIPLDEDRPLALLQALKPDLYVKGGDYAEEDLESAPFVRSYGGEVLIIPTKWKTSSSAIKAAIRNESHRPLQYEINPDDPPSGYEIGSGN